MKNSEKPVSFFPSQEAVQALEDSLLKLEQELLSKLKDDLGANSETPDDLSHVRMYYLLRKL